MYLLVVSVWEGGGEYSRYDLAVYDSLPLADHAAYLVRRDLDERCEAAAIESMRIDAAMTAWDAANPPPLREAYAWVEPPDDMHKAFWADDAFKTWYPPDEYLPAHPAWYDRKRREVYESHLAALPPSVRSVYFYGAGSFKVQVHKIPLNPYSVRY